jgi:hypothetical protein
MKKIEFLMLAANLFSFKTVSDKCGTEFILFSQSNVNSLGTIQDKTEFEAIENHVHLCDNIKSNEFETCLTVGNSLGKALLASLKCCYPEKTFCVYVSIHLHDSFIIRFHQKWNDEQPYYNPQDFITDSTMTLLSFER